MVSTYFFPVRRMYSGKWVWAGVGNWPQLRGVGEGWGERPLQRDRRGWGSTLHVVQRAQGYQSRDRHGDRGDGSLQRESEGSTGESGSSLTTGIGDRPCDQKKIIQHFGPETNIKKVFKIFQKITKNQWCVFKQCMSTNTFNKYPQNVHGKVSNLVSKKHSQNPAKIYKKSTKNIKNQQTIFFY